MGEQRYYQQVDFMHFSDSSFALATRADIQQEIIRFADEFPDEEVCGVVLKSGDVVRSHNVADNKINHFALDDSCTSLVLKGEAILVFHSHCTDEHPRVMEFSGMVGEQWMFGDVFYSQHFQIPYLMFHLVERTWDYYDPRGLHPLPLQQKETDPTKIEFYLGWQWMWGRADCCTLLLSYFQAMVGIALEVTERSPNPAEYLEPGWDRLRAELIKNDFVSFDKRTVLKEHDVILMRIHGENWHHIGIIVDARRHCMLHHLIFPRMSERIVYGGDWFDQTLAIYRHRSLI